MAKAAKPPTTTDALFTAVETNPDDAASYVVLADALEQAGDSRAELVQVQCRLASATGKDKAKLETTEQTLIKARRKSLLGKLDTPNVDLEFRYGFIDRAKLAAPLAPDDIGKALAAVFAAPEARLLRTIAIIPGDDGRMDYSNTAEADDGDDGDDDDDDDDDGENGDDATAGHTADALKSTFEVLAKGKAKAPATLRTLVLGNAFEADRGFRCFSDPWSLSNDDISKVLDVFPSIQELRVDLGALKLTWAALESERLKRFTWLSPSAPSDDVQVLAKSKLPALEAFTLGSGGQYLANYDYEVASDGLAGAMDQEECIGEEAYGAVFDMLDDCEHLRELGLPNFDSHKPTLFETLAKHGFVKRLRTLDLSWTELDGDDVKALAKLLKKMPELRELRLEGTSVENKKALATPNVKLVGEPAKGNKRYRYIVTME